MPKTKFSRPVLCWLLIAEATPFVAWAQTSEAKPAIDQIRLAASTAQSQSALPDLLNRAEKITGRPRIVIASSEKALPGVCIAGTVVRITVMDRSVPDLAASGTVRITSASTRYDSGYQALFLDPTRRTMFFHWDTAGVSPASDYQVFVRLTAREVEHSALIANVARPELVLSLRARPFEPWWLEKTLDASASAAGFPLEFRRVWPQDSANTPYVGPLGRGWMHNYDVHLDEFPDGRVAFLGQDGYNRWFVVTPEGGYLSSPGDFATLQRYGAGFLLREKSGLSWVFLHDGKLDYVSDPNNNRVTAAYDVFGRLATLTHSNGPAFHLQYNATGQLDSLTDHVGRQTLYSYSADGSTLLSVTAPTGATTSYSYLPAASTPSDYRLVSVARPDGARKSWAYDSLGRITSQANESATGKFSFSYDAAGKTSFQDSSGNTTTVQVNDQRRPVRIIDPAGSVSTFRYDHQYNLAELSDPLGQTSHITWDERGNIIRFADAAGTVTWGYDDMFNKPLWVRDARGAVVSFAYDGNGNRIRTTYPDGTSETAGYDSRGSLISLVTRPGAIINYRRDARGSLLSRTSVGISDAYTWDAAGNLTSASGAQGLIGLKYDSADRLTAVTFPGQRTFSFSYDAAGRRTQLADPDAKPLTGPLTATQRYKYDAGGRVSEIDLADGSALATYSYDPLGRTVQRTLGNATTARYSYDPAGQLADLTTSTAAGGILSRFRYTRDVAGNVLSTQTPAAVTNYTYDAAGRLISAATDGAAATALTYDAQGNRDKVVKGTVTEQYLSNNLNQYTSAGSASLTWDAAGNLASRALPGGTFTYEYDALGRLIAVKGPAGNVTYAYDALGFLYARSDSSGTTHFLRDEAQIVIQENDSYQTIARIVRGPSADELLVQTDAKDNPVYLMQDGSNNVVGETDTAGALRSAFAYDVFGSPTSTVTAPRLLPGGALYDPVAGLSWFRSRWYSPALGRYIQPNPLGIDAGLNFYSYARNNPVRYRDPSGLGGDAEGGVTGLGPSTETAIAFGAIGGLLEVAPSGSGIGAGTVQFISGLLDAPSENAGWQGLLGGTTNGGMDPRSAALHGFGASPALGGGLTGIGGGACPTFIQLADPASDAVSEAIDISSTRLSAKITVPVQGALVRADVPVFGVAGGTDFSEYRVEYGKGLHPDHWILIDGSQSPRPSTRAGIGQLRTMQGDIDIRGNLATWNTGLGNWVHLPWHPPEDPTNLNGVYTLRLTVTGKNGETVEDRLTVTVGEAIAQALPGIVRSPDDRVKLRFPAQSLTRPFRVFSILPLEGNETEGQAGEAQRDARLIGPAYEIRDAGDRFNREVSLEFSVEDEEVAGTGPSHAGIALYSARSGGYTWLPTSFVQKGSKIVFTASIRELDLPRAIYGLLLDNSVPHSGPQEPVPGTPAPLQTSGGVLLRQTFERSLETWHSPDLLTGAILERDNSVTPDGTWALRLTNPATSGNFSVSVLDQPFDVTRYPLMSFDYRIGPDVRIDVYVLIAGRWYNIGFTGDPVILRNRDVNIGNAGRIPGVVADGTWRHASVDLRLLLERVTRQTRIDEIRMADWDVTGYMKLDFGHNARGSRWYVDNFTLAADGTPGRQGSLVIDDFTEPGINRSGRSTGAFSTPGASYCKIGTGRAALRVSWDTTLPGSWCGYYSALNTDLSGFEEITLRVRDTPALLNALVGLRDGPSGTEVKLSLAPWLAEPGPDGWSTAHVPLSAFLAQGLSTLKSPDLFTVTFENRILSGKGSLLLSEIRAEPALHFHSIFDIRRFPSERNLLGGAFRTSAHGAASISAGYHEDESHAGSIRLSYGGTIGLNYGDEGFSYAVWETGLEGFDARPYDTLVLRIRGQKGGELPNIYLDDGVTRRCLRAREFAPLSDSWQEVRLPLKSFAAAGIDLSHLEALQLDFEWQEMSGTIYVSDAWFAREYADSLDSSQTDRL